MNIVIQDYIGVKILEQVGDALAEGESIQF